MDSCEFGGFLFAGSAENVATANDPKLSDTRSVARRTISIPKEKLLLGRLAGLGDLSLQRFWTRKCEVFRRACQKRCKVRKIPATNGRMMFETLLAACGIYLLCGVAFALPFAWIGVGRVDPQAVGGSWGFRLLIIPGTMFLWPLLAWRWMKGLHEPPEENSPHRRAARKAAQP